MRTRRARTIIRPSATAAGRTACTARLRAHRRQPVRQSRRRR